MFADRFMGTAMFYPANYGYVPQTLSEDGDPVDVLVVTPFPLQVGVVMPRAGRAEDGRQIGHRRQAGGRAGGKTRPMYKDVQSWKTCRNCCAPRSATSSALPKTWKRASG